MQEYPRRGGGNLQATVGLLASIPKGRWHHLHHTKYKADVAVTRVIADLTRKEFVPCVPLSEHQPHDIVAIDKEGTAFKFQVKFASLKSNGTVDVKFRTSWVDNKGVHTRKYGEKEFDYYAIYCLQKDLLLYIPNKINCPKAIRFGKPANNQEKFANWASDYLQIKRESSETIRHTPEKVKT